MNPNVCPVCHLPLAALGKRADARYCSDLCRSRRRRSLSARHDWLGAWAAESVRKCERCGVSLWRYGVGPARANRRFCSTRCRVAAHRAAAGPSPVATVDAT